MPVGSTAEAQKVVCQASVDPRQNVNDRQLGEQHQSQPKETYPPAKDTHIVRAAIHPGIGIARIGNSRMQSGYYIGPEVVQPPLTRTGKTRDTEGAIKRQASRFRIYGYNCSGDVVREIDANDAEIQWTVHLANKKGKWYQFRMALDIPEAKDIKAPLRNADLVAARDRRALAIDPGPRTIEGKRTSGKAYQFDSGTFRGIPVPLGEIRTDEAGRLLVLGGHGESASPSRKPIFDRANPASFGNADGWFDDVSDGPVTAKASIDRREIPVESAWVAVAPPNYAPDVIGWRTLYDPLLAVLRWRIRDLYTTIADSIDGCGNPINGSRLTATSPGRITRRPL